jgi:hypothetical protein
MYRHGSLNVRGDCCYEAHVLENELITAMGIVADGFAVQGGFACGVHWFLRSGERHPRHQPADSRATDCAEKL